MESLNVPRENNTRIQNNRESKVSSGQIDHLGASSVNAVRDSSGLAGSQVRSVEGKYCNMSQRQDACEVIKDGFVKYEEPRIILYEKGNTKPLEVNSHMSDDMESRKSEDMKT